MAVIGIDSHKDTLVGCLIDADERVVEHRDVPNSAHGHAELVTWAQTAGVERVGIEGSGNYGRPAAQALWVPKTRSWALTCNDASTHTLTLSCPQVERNARSRHVEHAEPSFGERTGWA